MQASSVSLNRMNIAEMENRSSMIGNQTRETLAIAVLEPLSQAFGFETAATPLFRHQRAATEHAGKAMSAGDWQPLGTAASTAACVSQTAAALCVRTLEHEESTLPRCICRVLQLQGK